MPDGFDVFLNHNSGDKPIVEEIGVRLRGEGLRVWLDIWELRPGFPWQEGIEEAVQASRAVAVCVGKNGLGAWQEPEMRAFIARSRREKIPVIPVLLPGCPESPKLTLFLEAFTWVDLRDGLTEAGLARLVWGITGTKPPTGPAPETRRPKVWWRWGFALSLLVVLAVAAWRLWPRLTEPPPPQKQENAVLRPDENENRQEPAPPKPGQDSTPKAAISAVKVPLDGRISLSAEHKEWEGGQGDLRLGAEPNPQVKIHLKEPETLLRGQVVDQSGRGVSGAKVFWHGGTSGFAFSNEEGHFELRLAVPAGEKVRLRAELGEQTGGATYCFAGSDCSIIVGGER
jgi:hypothetical protein